MSNADAHSTITITIKGVSQSLEDAAAHARASLAGMGESATTSDTRLRRMGEGARAAEHEMTGMAAGTRLASDALQLFDSKATSSYYQLMSLGGIAKEMGGSFGQLRAAVFGSVEAFAAMGTINFLSGSVTAAIEADTATQSLNAALAKTPALAHAVNDEAERGAGAWARYGVTVSQLKGAMATGLGAGIKPETLIGNPKTIADIAAALGTDVPTALHQITAGASSAQAVVSKLGLSMAQQNRLLLPMRWENGDQRLRSIMQAVEHSNFAGQGDARASAAAGSFKALGASLKDLQESVGTTIVPALTAMAQALTGVLNAANQLLSGFGGLGNVLRNTWLPLVGLGVVLFTGLRSVVFDLAGKLIGTVVNAFGQTTQAMVTTEQEAIRAGDAMKGIPPETRTVAIFDSAGATSVKEPYIANVLSVPKEALTIAVFDNATAEAAISALDAYGTAHPVAVPVVYDTTNALVEATPTAIDVPVHYDTTNALTEASPTPISVPVTYDTSRALVEATPAPLAVPVTYDTSRALVEATPAPLTVPVRYDTTNALVEATPTALTVPVRYDTTNALVEATPTPLLVPVRYDAAHALTEATPAPLTVPVRYDATNAFVEATAHPLQVEATYDFTNAFHEATAHPIDVPVRYDTSRAFTEAHATAIDVPVRYDTARAFHEATETPIDIPVRYDFKNLLHEASATPITIPVRYDTTNALHEASAHGIDVPVTTHNVDQGKLDREIGQADAYAATHPVNLPLVTHNVDQPKIDAEIRTAQVYAAAHPIDVPVHTTGTVRVATTGATLDVTPVLDPRHAALDAGIRTTVQNEVNAGGPVKVWVTPQWVHGAGRALAGGLAMGAGVAITSAIFQSVKIDHVDGFTPPVGKAPPAPQVHVTVPAVRFPSQQHVYVDNLGALPQAMAGGKPPPATPVTAGHSAPTGTIPVRVMNAYDIGSRNNPITLSATTPIQATINTGKPFKVSQDGTWKVHVEMDWGDIARTIGEIAIGSAIGTALGSLGLGGLKMLGGGFKNWLRGNSGDGGDTPPGGDAASAAVAEAEKIVANLPKGAVGDAGAVAASLTTTLKSALVGPAVVAAVAGGFAALFGHINWGQAASQTLGAALIGPRLVAGLASMLKDINWGAMFDGATIGPRIALSLGSVLLGGFALLQGSAGGSKALIGYHNGIIDAFTKMSAQWVSSFISGLASKTSDLLQAGKDIVASILSGVSSATTRQKTTEPLHHTTPPTHHGAPTSAGGHGASLIYVSPALAASLRGAASSGAAVHQQHTHTHQETHHQQITNNNHFVINGAQHPEAIQHQITQALLDVERGVAEAARKGGGGGHGRSH